ncbi:ATP synthase subunit B [Carabus blaptoides fortunei]
MLSRAAVLSGQQSRILTALATRATQTSAPACAAAAAESGERDLVNFPRPVRLSEPGKVRLGFVPEEWFQFFYKKTGVTGPYAFGVGLMTYLCSKEIYVMEHEYYTGLSIAIMAIFAVKKMGPGIAQYADKEIEKYETSWTEGRENEIHGLEQAVKEEEQSQWQAEGQMMLMQAKRENVALQLEAAYRERLMAAYSEVKRRLDYQLERQSIETRIAHKHMIAWVVKSVLSSITPDQDKQTLNKCIADLSNLAKTV